MKRAVKALSILCGGLLIISPLNSTSFAEDLNDRPKTQKEIVQSTERLDTKEEPKANEQKIDDEKAVINVVKPEIVQNTSQVEQIENVEKEQQIKQENNQPQEVIKQEDENKSTVEVIEQLNLEQSKELLKMRNPNVEYIYQGDENTFEVLKEKNLSGYVFLPNVDGDLGYFVDKNTTNIYYFHPSGYLDLIV